jgi:hypothetical protein
MAARSPSVGSTTTSRGAFRNTDGPEPPDLADQGVPVIPGATSTWSCWSRRSPGAEGPGHDRAPRGTSAENCPRLWKSSPAGSDRAATWCYSGFLWNRARNMASGRAASTALVRSSCWSGASWVTFSGPRRQRDSGRRRRAPRPVHGTSARTRSKEPGFQAGRVPSAAMVRPASRGGRRRPPGPRGRAGVRRRPGGPRPDRRGRPAAGLAAGARAHVQPEGVAARLGYQGDLGALVVRDQQLFGPDQAVLGPLAQGTGQLLDHLARVALNNGQVAAGVTVPIGRDDLHACFVANTLRTHDWVFR